MPTGLTNPSQPSATSTGASEVIGFGDYIDRQLNKVRTFIRLSDLGLAITTCAALVSALLFLLILVDHWLFDLGLVGRTAALAAMLGIVGYCGFVWILPLIVKRLNPAYIARVIEQGEPALKNSLLNFVLFRAQPHSVRKVILEAVERRAAVDLSRVNVEMSIDRTPLIRSGAALGALLVGLALYAIFSPKDPLQTIARVLTPWSNRARPSRVQIIDVEPGNTTIYAGRQLIINATIENLAQSEGATVVYSTPDGQVVDAQLAMHSSGDARWSASLPETADGLQQDVTYLISAGDAVAGPYRVDVLPAPSIVVQRLDYDYPDYTRREPMVVEQTGNIDALEGTRVTVHATANQDIDYAYIEFDAFDNDAADNDAKDNDAADNDAADDPASPRQTLTMTHDGRVARSSFTLRLLPDRRTPWHLNYQVRFRNTDGATNDRPVQYDIQVTPDIPPVVEILTPTKRELDLPVNATQWIEVRAVDPDHGLSAIGLRAVKGSTPLLDEELLNQGRPPEQSTIAITGQQVVKYAFTPSKLDLQPGDVVVYWARGSDNRVEPDTTKAAPNVTKTQQYRFRITAPEDNRRASSDKEDATSAANGDRSANDSGKGDPDKGDPDGEGQNGGDARDPNNSDPNNSGQRDDSQPDDSQRDDSQRDDSQPGDNDERGSRDDQQSDEQQGQQEQNNTQDQSDASGDQQARQQQQDEGTASPQQNGGADGQERDSSQDADGPRDQSQQQTPADDSGPDGTTGEKGTGADDRDASDADRQQDPTGNDGQSRQTGDQSEQSNPDGSPQTDDQSNGSRDDGQAPNDVQSEPQSGDGSRAAQTDSDKPRSDDGDAKSADKLASDEKSAPGENSASDESTSDDDLEPLPNDGSRDGDAMERILKQIRERTGKQPENAVNKPCDKCDDGSCESCQHAAQSGRTASSGSDSNSKEGQPSAAENGSQQPRGAADSRRDTTADSRQNETTQDGDQAKRDGQDQDAGGQDAGSTAEPPEDTASDAPASGDSSEAGDGTSGGQRNADDPRKQDATNDAASPPSPKPTSHDGASDNQDSAAESPQQSGDPGKMSDADPQEAGESNGASSATGEGATDPNGGTSPPSQNDAAASDVGELGGEEPNLEYARKATDLVLQYLKDQENQRDRDLLDKLGWSPEDLQKFQQRWEQMRREAEQNNPVGVSARKELDEVLRSLGLTPTRDRLQAAGARDDRVQARNTGRRSKPPASYRERYQRFLKSMTNKGSAP